MDSQLSSRRSVDNLPTLPSACGSNFEFFSTPIPKLSGTATAVAAGEGYSGIFNSYRSPIGDCVHLSPHTQQLVRELGGSSYYTVDRNAARTPGLTFVPCSPRIRGILLDASPRPHNLSASFERAAAPQSFLEELSAADSPSPRGRLQERLHQRPDGDNPHPTRGRGHTRHYASPSDSPEAPTTDARAAAHHRRFVSSASDDPFTSSASYIPTDAPSGTHAFSPIRPRTSAPALARADADAPLRPGRNHSGSLPPINRSHNAGAAHESSGPPHASPSSVHAFHPDSPHRDANQYKKVVAARHLSSLLLAVAAKFPHTYRAYYEHAPTSHNDLDVLPLSSLHEGIDSVIGQWYGYLLVSNSVKRAAPSYGDLGKEAASAFTSTLSLDLLMADAIVADVLDIDKTPADRVLCLLPIAQLALAVASTYLRRPDEGLSTAVLTAAASVSFADPRQPGKLRIAGLDKLRSALALAQESGAHCDWNTAYTTIAKRIVGTSNLHYASDGSYDVTTGRRRPPLSWDNFRSGVKHKLEQASYSTADDPVYFTAGHLSIIASKLNQFAIEIASDTNADFDSVHAVLTSERPSSSASSPAQETVADVLAVLRALMPAAASPATASPASTASSFRPDQPCWTTNCTSKTTSRRVSCLKCRTIRPGAWMCPTCNHGNPASSNICVSRGCTGEKSAGRGFVTSSADGARELAEAEARVAASKARYPRRPSPALPPPPQGAPAIPLTFRVTIAPDDALAPLIPPEPASLKPESQRAPSPNEGETPNVRTVVVEPPRVATGGQHNEQGLLFQLPVTIQNADFPLLIGQRTIEKLGWLPAFGHANEPWLRAPNGCFYRLQHDHGESLCLPVVVGTLDDGGPVLYVGAHGNGRRTQLIMLDNCSQATTVPVGNADLVFARSSRPGTDVKSATGHHGVSVGSGLLRFFFCEGDGAAPEAMCPYPPPSVVAAILGPATLTSAATPAAATQIAPYVPAANVVTRSHARSSTTDQQPAQQRPSDTDGTTGGVDKGAASSDVTRRPFSTPVLSDADAAAERFNLFSRSEIEYFPQLVDGVDPLKLDDRKGYGRGALLLQAAMRRTPIYSALSENSYQRLLDTAPATSWDCDVFTLPEPDQDGNTTIFNFFERRTSTPFLSFSPCKGAAAFVVAVTQLEIYSRYFCPGVDLEDLSGDFDSSWAVNGKPGDTMPAELRTFCASRPRLRIVPKPPYSPALNRAELPQQRLKVFMMMNCVRARLSFRSICDMARGAWFQLMHQRVPHSREKVLRENTRVVALQLLHGVKKPKRLVASNVLGFPGQFGFALAEDGKPGRLRDKGELVYYVHLDMMGMGAHWVRYVASGRLAAVRSVTLVKDPDAVPALLARPGVALAHGLLGRPPQSAYTDHVDALIKDWTAPDIELKALRIDSRTGLPSGVISYVPVFDEETRTIIAVERADELVAPATGDTAPVTTPLAAPTVAASSPQVHTHTTLKRLPHRTLHSGRLELDSSAKAWFLRLPKGTAISVDPNGKAPGSASYDRYAMYKHARTIGELGPLSGQRRKDVMWDLAHGNILVGASDIEIEAAVNAVSAATKPAEGGIPPGVDPKYASCIDSLELVDEQGMERLKNMLGDAYTTERRTLLEFERLENLEDNPRPLDPDGGRALHSSLIDAAFSSEDEVRVLLTRALVDDYGLAKGPTISTPSAADEDPRDTARVYAIGAERIRIDADLARVCAISAVDIDTPKSVKEMERHPLFDAPKGWKVDFTKEVTELLVPACEVVGMSAFHEAVVELGAANVDMGYVLAVFRVKRDADGDFTKCRGRVVYAAQSARDDLDKPPVADKYANYSGCADAPSNRIHSQIALQLGAEQTSDDVPHAYWRGTPPSGRAVFAHVPEWAPRYFPGWRERYGDRTKGLLLRITANMPGRRDAGRIWFEYMDKFLRSFGLRPCAFDPRCYYLAAADGTLLILLHVDDTRLTYTTIAVCKRYREAFKLKFNCEPAPLGQTDFTGLRHEFITDADGGRRCEITCNSAITSLETLLTDYPLPPTYSRDVPMASDALAELRLPVSVTNPLAIEHLTPARRIAGTVGFIVTMVRVDGYFGFCVVARYVNADRITHRVWLALLRLAHYLVHTRGLALTLWRVPPAVELEAFCDSSLGNGVEGRSMGGSMALFPGSGALWWTCSTPSKTGESTGVAELHQIVRCIKAVTGTRIFLKELGCAPTRPTLTHTDSRTALDAARSSRVSWDSKWVCTRLAMVRNYEADGTGVIAHKDTDDLAADLLSKPLVGDAFFKHRATALGLRTSDS